MRTSDSTLELSGDSPIDKAVSLLLEGAVRAGASDIHIEPREALVQVRCRVDGMLRETSKLPRNALSAFTSRIKSLANLKVDEHRVPQEGKFRVPVNGMPYAAYVSILPVADGEKVVLRLFDQSSKTPQLADLGCWGQGLTAINQAIVQPHGLVLTSGPSDSGKSAALYSILDTLNEPTRNISTIEDPIDRRIQGINQTQVNLKAGLTFASGLRVLLRQDPNVVMVGKLENSETAQLAVQVALSGRLVFSTLYTNNAATALARLQDMGIEPFLIASTVRALMGQRLMRRLCEACRQAYKPKGHELKAFAITSKAQLTQLHELEKQALKAGIGAKNTELATKGNAVQKLWRASDKGCEACNHTGYKGRTGVFEVLPVSADMQKLLTGHSSSAALQNQAVKEGMVTMQVDGLVKALRGQTSLEEVLRVTSS